MPQPTGSYPPLKVDTAGKRVVSHAGAVLLVATAGKVGLDRTLSAALTPWRKQWAVLDPGKILLDLAISVAVGGDCLADIGVLRSEPVVFGRVASDPTVSRLVDALAATPTAALAAINQARATVRERVWKLAGRDAPDFGISRDRPLVIDLDATLITSHSEKELAAPTYKRGFGFHPLGSWVDHGPDGTGEPLSMMLRPGRAGSNTAADHIQVTKDALRQLPSARSGERIGRKVLIRADGGGGTHEFLGWWFSQGLSYSVGFGLSQDIVDKINQIPDQGWTPAYDADGKVRDGAWVTELTGILDLQTWPPGMRVIIRAERPHPGAQLRFTDVDGNRLTAFTRHHHPRATCGPGTAAPPSGPLRRPDPQCKGHRPAKPAAHVVRTKPNLDRSSPVGDRAHQLAADARPDRHRSPPVGTETDPAATVLSRRDHRPPIPTCLVAPIRPRPAPAPVQRWPDPAQRPPAPHLTTSTPRQDQHPEDPPERGIRHLPR